AVLVPGAPPGADPRVRLGLEAVEPQGHVDRVRPPAGGRRVRQRRPGLRAAPQPRMTASRPSLQEHPMSLPTTSADDAPGPEDDPGVASEPFVTSYKQSRFRRRHKGPSLAVRGRLGRVTAAEMRAEEITAWFGERKVLDRVSLTMPAGQVTSLIGPSGCG